MARIAIFQYEWWLWQKKNVLPTHMPQQLACIRFDFWEYTQMIHLGSGKMTLCLMRGVIKNSTLTTGLVHSLEMNAKCTSIFSRGEKRHFWMIWCATKRTDVFKILLLKHWSTVMNINVFFLTLAVGKADQTCHMLQYTGFNDSETAVIQWVYITKLQHPWQ